jgi:pimeloyl-ACP methyl ester carboxylesterase
MADLTKGVIVILSGGGFDEMNPVEVRDRMDECITQVNNDPFVQASSSGQGLTYQLFASQTTKHLHQGQWRAICDVLNLREATPLIVVGHSNGGAAAMSLARCLQAQGKTIDLLFSADSVLTLDDLGEPNEVPANVTLNINTYVKPTPAWFLFPFPIGRRNKRETDHSLDGILNVGLKFNLPGALAHRNAFYDLAGGDKTGATTYRHPLVIQDSILASLHGTANNLIMDAAIASLRVLATQTHTQIEVSTTGSTIIIEP